eukprot:TRINITY_DN12992_c0_g1_i1.p1 TRINITY_DN12992_c0_g1~~TRINITY_DN12992_c0_g1_i1.p1  ORF type:complete len:337 (+),score=93.00 TRINITY_DN12992_c0_g1_i1:230-1240(+)
MSESTPYIGSKISLVSNSEIRYEGILYTINSQESTIALQSVRCLGTEGRKTPEIPASNEVYDFIIFRGQDIKDLRVESANSVMNDPAILSVNQAPPEPAAKGADKGAEKGSKSRKGKDYDSGKGYGKDSGGKGYDDGKGKGYDSAKGAKDAGKGSKDAGKGGKTDAKGDAKGAKGEAKGNGKASKGGKDAKGGKAESKSSKGEAKGGKADSKGSKGDSSGKGKGSRRGGGGRATIGELLPEDNPDTKRQFAEEFDFTNSASKFDKVSDSSNLKPLDGYDKGKSFFDSISCQATEQSGEVSRQRADRDKAREADAETFGDSKSERRGKGSRKGKGKS